MKTKIYFSLKSIIEFIFTILLLNNICTANMASPIREGTKSAAAFSSKDIDVLKEKLTVNIGKDFSSADFIADYIIRSDKEEKQIPLLFYAMNYKDDFKVWLDGVEIKLLSIPDDYLINSDSIFNGFSDYFEHTTDNNDEKVVKIQFEKSSGREYPLSDLKYFEVDLNNGEHTIRVEYTAVVWKNRSEWVNKYSFPYSLSPARYWRSFGELEVIINSKEFGKNISTNLGQQVSGNLNSLATWNYKHLPDFEVIEIDYTPEINSITKAMIDIDPFGLACIAGLLLAIFHLLLIRAYRIAKPERKFSWVMLTGSILVPFLIILFYILSFELVDNMIGNDAGKYHGYTFLAFAFYPVILIIYFIIMLIADAILKKRQLKTL